VRAQGVSGDGGDSATQRLIKYIPAEIISGYMLLGGMTDAPKDSGYQLGAAWGIFWLGVVLTPLYLWKVGHPRGVQWWQLPISTVAFVLWACALGGPFRMSGQFLPGYRYEDWLAALLAGAYSWIVALVWTPTSDVPPG
jgi:hypothetical protein